MPKIEVDDEQFLKLMDKSVEEHIRRLEKEVASLERKLKNKEDKITQLQTLERDAKEAIADMRRIAGDVHRWVDCDRW